MREVFLLAGLSSRTLSCTPSSLHIPFRVCPQLAFPDRARSVGIIFGNAELETRARMEARPIGLHMCHGHALQLRAMCIPCNLESRFPLGTELRLSPPPASCAQPKPSWDRAQASSVTASIRADKGTKGPERAKKRRYGWLRMGIAVSFSWEGTSNYQQRA